MSSQPLYTVDALGDYHLVAYVMGRKVSTRCGQVFTAKKRLTVDPPKSQQCPRCSEKGAVK